MEFNNFGEYLENLREKQKISRSVLCDGICSEKQLYRIEKSESEPSIYILNQLSLRLNVDLLEHYKLYNVNTLAGFKEISDMNDYFHNYDVRGLKKYLNSLKVSSFTNNSLFTENYYYAQAICFYKLDKDDDTALFYINKGLLMEANSIEMDISNIAFSNCGYSLLNLKASILLNQDKYRDAVELFLEIKSSLDKHFVNSKTNAYLTQAYIHRIYATVLSNIVLCHYYLNEYESVIDYANFATDYAVKNDFLLHLQVAFDYKARALYHIGDKNEAARLFNAAIALYSIDDVYKDYVESLKRTIAEEFPEVNII